MSENNFDNKISEILKGIDMPYEPSTWDALSAKLDQQVTPTDIPPAAGSSPDFQAFDQRMRSALDGIEMPYQPANWDKMAQRLDRSGMVNLIRRHKVAEAAIILLIAMNFQTIFDNSSRWFHMPPQEETPVEEPMAGNATRKHQHGKGTISQAIVGVLPTSPMAQAVVSTHLHSTPTTSNIAAVFAATIPNLEAQGTPKSINTALIGADGERIPQGLRPLTLLAALNLDQIDRQYQVSPMAGIYMPKEKSSSTTNNKRSAKYIMAHVGAARQQYKGSNDYQTNFNTATVGVQVGKRKGKWGVETGLAYTPQVYDSETKIVGFHKDFGRVLGTSYDQIQATIVSVPVKVTRRIARFGKNSVHAVAGTVANIAVEKNYTYKEIEYPTGPSALPTDKPSLPTSNGLFEGGKSGNNIYVSAEAGVRFERRLNNRMSAYVEPQYRRFVAGKGIGPVKGKTNAVGVQAGVVALL